MAENNLQQRVICYATGALRAQFRDRSDVHVRCDMFIDYRNGPRKFKSFPASSWCLATWRCRSSKRKWLRSRPTARTGTPRHPPTRARGWLEYWRFDPTRGLFRPPGEGQGVARQRLGPLDLYDPIRPGPSRWVCGDVLELDACEVEGRLRFWDYSRNRFLASNAETEERAMAAERRVAAAKREKESERRLRKRAERSAGRAEAEIATLRVLLEARRRE